MTMEYYSSSGRFIKVTSRRYYGSLMIEGSKRPRIYNPYGYIDVVRNDSAVYCFASVDRLGSVRAVTDLNGKLVQSMDYYSTGLPYSDVEAPLDDIHLYEGKPYIGLRSMGLYDNKARIYDAVNGRFNAPDALAWKYPHLSPYLSCAANPLLYIDYDGNEYEVEQDDTNKTIIIRANYYAAEEDYDELKKGTDFWNNITTQEKIGKEKYTVSFELSPIVPEPSPYPKNARVRMAAGLDDIGNGFIIQEELKQKNMDLERTGSCGPQLIKISKKLMGETTIAHEIGHSLGLIHSISGLMTPTQDDFKRTPRVSDYEISKIIEAAKTGTPQTDDFGQQGRIGYYKNNDKK